MQLELLPRTMPRLANRRRGAAMVEATLVLPLFLAFWFGIVDWGITFWIHETVVHNANTAVRWQTTNTLVCAADPCTDTEAARIIKLFKYGDPNSAASGKPWFSLNDPTVQVRLLADVGGRCVWPDVHGCKIEMTVSNYQWMHFTPYFASQYASAVRVSLPAEDLHDGY